MLNFCSDLFNWSGGRGSSTITELHLNRFPDRFCIVSDRTGRSEIFAIDTKTMEENEFFDGEGSAYISQTGHKIHLWY